jgi:transposase
MQDNELDEIVLPTGILEHYKLTWIKREEGKILIHLDENARAPSIPAEHRGKGIRSKGLTRPREIEDFPIQGQRTFLVIRRRKWKITGEKELIIRELDVNFPGTRLTKGFANFLKEASRK